jgi:WD40 repeat protein
LQGHTNIVWCCVFSPDGALLATASSDTTAKVWDGRTGVCLRTLQGHTAMVFGAVSFRPTACSSPPPPTTGRPRSGRPALVFAFHTLQGHNDWVTSCSFSPDGALLATGSSDAVARLWDTRTFACIRTLQGHTTTVSDCAFRPDGMLLATASDDATVKIWDISAPPLKMLLLILAARRHRKRHPPAELWRLILDEFFLFSLLLDARFKLKFFSLEPSPASRHSYHFLFISHEIHHDVVTSCM